MSAAMTIRLSLSRHIVTTLKKKNALVQGREGAGGHAGGGGNSIESSSLVPDGQLY